MPYHCPSCGHLIRCKRPHIPKEQLLLPLAPEVLFRVLSDSKAVSPRLVDGKGV